MKITLTAHYNKEYDFVDVRFFKHEGECVYKISSGLVQLMDMSGILAEGEIDDSAAFIHFAHPRSLNGLYVRATIDGLSTESAVSSTMNSDPESVVTKLTDFSVVHSSSEPKQIIKSESKFKTSSIDFDFSKDINYRYSGGGRYVIDSNGKIVKQEKDKVYAGLRYCEPTSINLFTPDLFSCDYELGSFYNDNSLGTLNLQYRFKGVLSSANIDGSLLRLTTTPVKARTFQAYLSLPAYTGKSFKAILSCNGINKEYTLNTSDYSNFQLFSHSFDSEGLLSVVFEFPNCYEAFTFNMLMPQLTTLAYPTTYSDLRREGDVVNVDAKLPNAASFIINCSITGNDGYFFDCGDIYAKIDNSSILFNCGGTLVSYPIAGISNYSNFTFGYDKSDEHLVFISVEDVVVAQSIEPFTIQDPNVKLFIGCDKSGSNQLFGVIKKFKLVED